MQERDKLDLLAEIRATEAELCDHPDQSLEATRLAYLASRRNFTYESHHLLARLDESSGRQRMLAGIKEPAVDNLAGFMIHAEDQKTSLAWPVYCYQPRRQGIPRFLMPTQREILILEWPRSPRALGLANDSVNFANREERIPIYRLDGDAQIWQESEPGFYALGRRGDGGFPMVTRDHLDLAAEVVWKMVAKDDLPGEYVAALVDLDEIQRLSRVFDKALGQVGFLTDLLGQSGAVR